MKRLFASEYVKHFRTVGAVAPSSKYLARQMVAPIDFASAKVIVQFGPGTGSFTRALIDARQPDTKLLLIERNQPFCDVLVKEFGHAKNVIIEHDSAAHVRVLLHKHHLGKKVDYIVSGLPFASLPHNESTKILAEAVSCLKANGLFITFQYTLLKKSFLAHYFSNITTKREWRNVPPAYILTCRTK